MSKRIIYLIACLVATASVVILYSISHNAASLMGGVTGFSVWYFTVKFLGFYFLTEKEEHDWKEFYGSIDCG